MAELTSFRDRVFLLDTCVLQDIGSKGLGPKILNTLLTLIQQGNTLAVTDFATYELLRGASKENETKGENVLNRFTRYQISTEVCRAAARLETLYKNEGVDSGISDGDKILAATSVMTEAPVVTRDGMDFPRPFFNEIYRETIPYERSKRRSHTTVLYFLESDLDVILRKFNERL